MTVLPNKYHNILGLAGIFYGVMLVYGSLMPFDFVFDSHAGGALSHFFNGWPVNPAAPISGSDVISNLALYIPLGWLAAVHRRPSRIGGILSLMIAIAICSCLSVCIEVAQAFTLTRTSSAADWLLNTISGSVGATAGAIWGVEMWEHAVYWVEDRWKTRPADVATLVLMSLLTADALSPYLPTIEISQVWHNLKHAHFQISTGLGEHLWHWWIFTRLMVYSFLTMLLSKWGERTSGRRHWLRAAIFSALFALGLELGKPMIVSRTINMANVAMSCLGSLAAIAVGVPLAGRVSSRSKMNLAIAALLSYSIYLEWTPLNFRWIPERVSHQIPTLVQMLPFYDYAMGGKLDDLRMFMQSVLIQSILVCLLRMQFGWFEKRHKGLGLAALCSAAFGLLLECGQIFLPSRTPTMTDVYCFALGGALGAWVRLHPTNVLATRDQSEGSISLWSLTPTAHQRKKGFSGGR